MRELLFIFQDVEEPRRGNAKRHDLHEMLVLALVAMLTSGRTCVDMEDFGREREEWLRQYLTLENGIPSHDTFSRLFRKLDPAGLQRALLRLAQDWADELGDVAAVDGKALRRSFETASERSPTHLLLTVRGGGEADAGAGEGGRQVERDPGAAGTAGTARREGAHGDRGSVYAHRGTAAAIVAKGGDYALQLKRNQGAMHADVVEYLDNPPKSAELLSHQQVGKGHGRVETRTATVCHDVGWLLERHDWPGLSAIGKVVAERRLGDGSESVDTRYYLLSAKLSAERFGRTVRSHWAIENADARVGRLHWVLDVSMDEDQARNRKGNGAACLAVVRRQALNMARMHPNKRSVRRKFACAQRNDDVLLAMIRGVRRHE